MSPGEFIQTIPPASHRAESRGVLLTAGLILLIWAAGVLVRHEKPTATVRPAHQQSAFTSLSPLEQGLFADLRVAAGEIIAWRAARPSWPDVAALADEGLSPFVRDAVWRRRGEHEWTRLHFTGEGGAWYWGRPADPETAGWILAIDGDQTTLWRHKEATSGQPQADLAAGGWREIVAAKNSPP